jgi:roadblock/LC7 domain-containing protein
MDQDEVREEWREAARSSAQNMLEDCNYWISRLQPRKRGLTPEECFHLWSELGYLRFHIWSRTLPKKESDALSITSKMLQEQLSEALVRHTAPHCTTSGSLVRLEGEMAKVIEKMQDSISEANQLLKEHRLADSWAQIEFDHWIQDPMDKIGYTLELLRAVNLSLSQKTIDALAILEQNLRDIFPEAVRQYWESGQPIDAGRAVWPESFWWRQSDR